MINYCKCEELETDIKCRFSRHMADRIAEVVQKRRESEHRKCKLRQVNKYDRLKEKSSNVEKKHSKSTKQEVGG